MKLKAWGRNEGIKGKMKCQKGLHIVAVSGVEGEVQEMNVKEKWVIIDSMMNFWSKEGKHFSLKRIFIKYKNCANPNEVI